MTILRVVLIFGSCLFLLSSPTAGQELRLNQIQVIGTHNSYRLAPPPPLLQIIRLGSDSGADALDYSHRPIDEQLSRLSVRQLELDIYADPKGGLYSRPDGYDMLVRSGVDAGDDPNQNGVMNQPGMKILHSPGYDYRSTVPTLVAALTTVRQWSKQNPAHAPIMILLELKDSVVGPVKVKPLPFDSALVDSVDKEIRSVFSNDELVTPDFVRGNHATLRDAVMQTGWPLLSQARGKVLFALDNGGAVRDLYVAGHTSLEGRVMFASVEMNHPAAAFLKLNDPVGERDLIRNAVQRGFLVRTRADAETREARRRDTSRREAAFSSGAQYISTDYPEPDTRFSDYSVRFADDQMVRINPVSAANWRGTSLQDLIELTSPQSAP